MVCLNAVALEVCKESERKHLEPKLLGSLENTWFSSDDLSGGGGFASLDSF